MIEINYRSGDKYFTINNKKFARIYQAIESGSNEIAVYNINDTRQQILGATHYADILVNGAYLNSQDELIQTLIPILYNDATEVQPDETPLITDTVFLTSFDEFGYDTEVKSNTVGDKYFNSIYEWLVQGNITPQKTDFAYTVEEELSRLGSATNVLFWVNWFGEGFTNPTKIRPALQDSIKNEIGASDWSAGGYNADSLDIINIPSDYPISGSQNDQSLLNGMLKVQERGYKAGYVHITRYIDILNKNENWRGTVNWDNITDFQLWLTDYENMYKHYIDLFYNNGIDLGISYVGSEMASLSRDNALNSDIQKAWVDSLISLAKYTKTKFPECIVTYAADWTEYRYNLDRLWVSKYIDRIGIEFYFPILIQHTNDGNLIVKGNWEGEGIDFFFTGQNSAESLATTSSGVGKSNLTINTPLAKSSQLNNWKEWLNNPHYVNKRAGAIADTSPLVINSEYINTIFDDKSSEIMEGTSVLQTTINKFNNFQSGANRRLFKENCWLYSDGNTFSKFKIPTTLETNSQRIDSFKLEMDFDILSNHSSGFARLIRFNNWLDIFYDVGQSTLKMEWKQATSNSFLNAPTSTTYTGTNLIIELIYNEVNTNYDVFISVDGEQITTASFSMTADNAQAIFTNNIVYLNSYAGTSDFLESKIYKMNYHFGIGGEYYGGTYHFEDDVFGVRNEYDARFILEGNDKPVMATEIGIASINGSAVEPNVFPNTDRNGTGYIPNDNTKEYWEKVSDYGVEIQDIKIPYGSTAESDERHQQIGLKSIIEQIKKAGVKETAVYNLDARYHLAFKGQENNVLWFKDAGNHLYNHSLNGKKALGYNSNIYDIIKPD